MSITLARLKSNLYLKITNTEYDDAISELINGIVQDAIDYMDNEDITSDSNFSGNLERKICQQIAYEFRRRKDLGVMSVTFPDGSINKMEVEEWLPKVKKALDRLKVYTI